MAQISNPDRQYVSQYANDVLMLAIFVQGSPADPDGNTVTVTMTDETINVQVFTEAATRTDAGQFQVQLTSAQSQKPGDYTLTWEYVIDGTSEFTQTYIQIGQANPNYDNLVPAMKTVVENVYFRFLDLFDSPEGGPNLTTYFQTNFGRGRVAQLLRIAVGLLNTTMQPFMTFTLDGDGGASFPVTQWGALLEQALMVEVIKHLRRSYTEQPDFRGANISRLDRQQYWDRWGAVLQDEQATLKQQLDVFKISAMGLSRPQVLVSGGVYGRYGPTRYAGSAAARPRYWARFY
jgi:hypothetical protein